jgi:hypothetical protein
MSKRSSMALIKAMADEVRHEIEEQIEEAGVLNAF